MTDKPIVHSHGGGWQSWALSVLYCTGRLPVPDVVLMADTGRERSSTWRYAEEYGIPYLRRHGIEWQVAGHDLATVDLYGHNGDLLMPVYTKNGKLPTFCSTEWKQRVIERHLRSLGYGPKNPVTMWMGMSLDEVGRMKQGGAKWVEKDWPLVFNDEGTRFTRADCKKLIFDAGLPLPSKSSCFMCPHMRNSQWREIRDDTPEDWKKAVALDQEIRKRDIASGKTGVYLHGDLVPLAEADLEEKDRPQLALFGEFDGPGCDSGYCMT